MKIFIKDKLALKMVRAGKQRDFSINELERKHLNPDVLNFNDSSYFAGVSSDGFVVITRLAFRADKPNENWFKIYIPGEGIWGFENMELPEREGFTQGEFSYTPIIPGKEWSIKYKGPVFQDDKKEEVSIDLKWNSTVPIINFDKEGTSYEQVAHQIAMEKWNRQFFSKLKEIHKTHYEQAALLTGAIVWKGKKHTVNLKGIRDHSFGSRTWNDWERHIWYLGLLEDGRFFNISIVDYDFIKDLKAGFIWDGKSSYLSHYKTPSFKDLNLTEPLPTEVSFGVIENKGDSEILIKTDMKRFFPFMMDDIYHIRQTMAKFNYDGVQGIGIAEMGINTKRYKINSSN